MKTPSDDLGQPIPDTPHVRDESSRLSIILANSNEQAISVSLPTWKAVVGYEEGEEWVLGKLKTGYPR